MLCETGSLEDLKRPGYLGEKKLDGTHGFIQKRGDVVTIWNRHGIDYTRRLPELVEATMKSPHDFTLNGEIIYINPKTGEIEFTPCQRRCSTTHIAKQWYLQDSLGIKLDFAAWTILDLNGRNLEDTPYIERKEILRKIIPLDSRIMWLPHRFDLEEMWKETKANQEEGLIIKRVDGGYKHERSWDWLKVKNWRFETCDVVGYTPGKNARANFFGSLVLAKNGRHIGCAGSGPNDWELRQLKDILEDAPRVSKPFKIGEPYTAIKTNLR